MTIAIQIAALKITLANHLSFLAAETRSPTRQQNWAERRGFAIVVGHLGGICKQSIAEPSVRFKLSGRQKAD